MHAAILKRLDREIDRVDDQDIAILAREEGPDFPREEQLQVCRHLAWAASVDPICLRAYLTHFTSERSAKALADACELNPHCLPAHDPLVAGLLLARPDILRLLRRGGVFSDFEPFAKAGYGRLINPLNLATAELQDSRLELHQWLAEQQENDALEWIIRTRGTLTSDEHGWLTELIIHSSRTPAERTRCAQILGQVPVMPR